MNSKAFNFLCTCIYLNSVETLQDIVGNSDKTIFDNEGYDCIVERQENTSYFNCKNTINDGR